MLYPQSLTDAKIIVKYKTEKDNATFFNDSKEVSLTGEWTRTKYPLYTNFTGWCRRNECKYNI